MTFGNMQYILYIGAAALAVFAAFVFYLIWRQNSIKNIPSAVLKNLMHLSGFRRSIGTACILISILLFAIVLLRPQWGERTRNVQNEGSDVLIALDVSRSMLASDVTPNRLERAKNAIRWIADSLKGDRIGLIVFAGDAFLLCPLTSDIEAFMVFLDSADTNSIAVQGTDIGAVLNEALRVFQKKRLTEKLLVLISDGEDHEGNVSSAVEKLEDAGVTIYCAGIGREDGGFIPLSTGSEEKNYMQDNKGEPVRTLKKTAILEKISSETGGSTFDISDGFSGLKKVLDVIRSAQNNSHENRTITEPIERFAFFALPLVFLLGLELMLPEIPLAGKTASNSHTMNAVRNIFRRDGEHE